MINRARLEARLDELKTQRRQVEANLNALSGAILDLEYLLKEDSENEASETASASEV